MGDYGLGKGAARDAGAADGQGARVRREAAGKPEVDESIRARRRAADYRRARGQA